MPALERVVLDETGAPCYRLRVLLAVDTTMVLLKRARSRGLPLQDTIRRAIAVLDFIEDEVAAGNTLASIETDNFGRQRMRELVMVDDKPQPRSRRSALLRGLACGGRRFGT
ncbi:hypothetical protein [Kribbella sp. DT2]|uniref:hypothetical protein n=1 Tax=Kribbella sp. DT2 TaxID=3393427 RepID=UPI003CF667B7